MRIIACKDIFALPRTPSEAVCVTTNGIIKTNGRAVMGKGIALEADKRFKLSADLGVYLKRYDNRAFYMGVRQDAKTRHQIAIVTFPTKHHWRDPSDISLIKMSCEQVMAIADKFKLTTLYLPCPGCSNGGLDWETQVQPAIAPLLDNRFIVADKRFCHNT